MADTKVKKIKILLVEDDEFLAGMYVTKLNLEGFDVQLASDGEKGLRLAKEHNPDIILLDVVLPKMSGFDVLKSLKEDSSTKDVPVILLTNLGQRDDVQKGLDLGASDYLIKAHFMPSEVVTKMKGIMRK
ncbi:MAG: response regulator [Patescibacteria group bacterium]|nr:response regulator [Patescibacteria group bacterium]MDD5715432.1 response regulator [Patescibacteria group bacterium]